MNNISLSPTKNRSVVIRQCSMDNEDFRRLYRIFRLTICPDMSEKAFQTYYHSPDLDYIDVTFFYAASGELAGFSAAAFYNRTVQGKAVTIARSATGLLPQYRGGAFSKHTIYTKYMRYKLRHPWQRMILTIFASNPFIYGMVCKYTGMVYPRYNQPVPNWITVLKNNLLEAGGLHRRERQPFVVKINFEVEKSSKDRQKAFESSNPDVRFFVQQTGLQPCLSLLLIIPVSFSNILWCIGLMLWHSSIGKVAAAGKNWQAKAKAYKNRLTCWLNQSQPAGHANSKSL